MGSGVSARLNLTSGNASGNESEKITIPTESQPWACEIKLHRNHASEADQRDYPGMCVKLPALLGALTRMSTFLVSTCSRLRQGCRSGFGGEIILKSMKICTGARSLCGKKGSGEWKLRERESGRAREGGSEGARERGSEGARGRGSEGARERGSEGAREYR
jgi:hypothetical protein